MRRASDVPGTQRGVLLVVLALLLLGGANAVRAEDEPAARKPTNEGRASDAFLAARAAGDEKRMGEIANVASTSADPWRVTDALLARGEVEAARDLAKRARRPELSRLAGYVEEAIAKPRPAASREVFERMVHGRTGLSHAESLELIARVDVELLDVPTVVTLFWLGNTHYLLGEFDQTIDACRRAGEVAAAIGWTRMAAAQYALAGAVASDQKQEDVAMELIARQMENEFEGESAHGVDAASRVRPILLRRSMAAITGRGASDQEGLSYLGKLPVGPLFGELSRCSPNASTTWFLALGFQMGGETDRARALLENVRDRARYFASASDAAVLSYTLGEVYMASGRPSRGLETLTESIARARAEEMFVVATLATTVASMCAASLGEYERALGLAAQGLALVEEHGARVAAPVLYTAIARCEVNQGAYHAALRHLEKARGLHTALGAKTDATATGMEIGNVHVGLGDLDAAYAEFHAVQEQSEALKDVRGALSAMANLGVVELERGRLAEAEGIFRDVVTRARESKRPKSLAVGLTNLADVQRLRGRLDDAVATQDEALVVAGAQDLTRLLGDVHVDRALTELARGRHDAARTHAALAAKLAGEMGSAPLRLRADAARALLEQGAGRHAEALAAARGVATTLAVITGRVASTPGARARSRFAAALEVGATSAAALAKPEELAFFLETGRASLAREALGGRQVLAEAHIPADLRRREREAQARVERAARALAKARRRRVHTRVQAARTERDAARQALREVMERIEGEVRQDSELLYADVESLGSIRATLGPKQACVLYGLFEAKALALRITAAEARIVDLGPVAPIRTTLQAVRDAAQGKGASSAASARARSMLWEPLGLGAFEQVLVSPDGALCATPPALFVPAGVDVLYLPSATWHVRHRSRPRAPATRILALGDPAYGGRLPRLEASRAEVQAVGDDVLLGDQATEAGLRATLRTQKRWRAVHLACHGIVDAERPGLSHLALTPGPGGDGELLALDVHRLHVPADLVVLSACDSGLGRYVRGTGMLGLARAFLSAGGSQVLCSLWQVDDEATATLMRSFYEHWRGGQGMNAAAALRAAQAHVRTRDRTTVATLRGPSGAPAVGERPWSDPYYWAGWVVWGTP